MVWSKTPVVKRSPTMPSLQMPATYVGCILAGGRSSRMGGGDKPLLELAGKPLLAHVIERVSPQVSRVVLNANGPAERFEALGLPVVADTVEGLPGPLAGILAGLRWAEAQAPDCSHVVTVSGDAPFLPEDLVARLTAAVANEPGRIAIASSGGQPQPVMGLWPLAIADDLEAGLKAGARSVLAWATQRNVHHVDFPPVAIVGRMIDPFFNANTPLELAEARVIVQRGSFHSPVIGIVGWKNSGKTTLLTRLIAALTARGGRVSTIKFSHHEGTVQGADPHSDRVRDTTRHAEAGAVHVGFASPSRWALLHGAGSGVTWHEASGQDRTTILAAILSAMAPADLILVEGYKAAPIPKIEVRSAECPAPSLLAETDTYIFAIATDNASPVEIHGLPVLKRDDVEGVAALISRVAGLQSGQQH